MPWNFFILRGWPPLSPGGEGSPGGAPLDPFNIFNITGFFPLTLWVVIACWEIQQWRRWSPRSINRVNWWFPQELVFTGTPRLENCLPVAVVSHRGGWGASLRNAIYRVTSDQKSRCYQYPKLRWGRPPTPSPPDCRHRQAIGRAGEYRKKKTSGKGVIL